MGLTLASHINITEYNGVNHHQKQQQQQQQQKQISKLENCGSFAKVIFKSFHRRQVNALQISFIFIYMC